MAAFSTIAAVGLGAAGIGSSIIGANRQANAIEDAANTSDATTRYIYDDTVRRNEYREGIGNEAFGQIAGMYGLGQGQNAGQSQQGGMGQGQTQGQGQFASYLNNNPDLVNWYQTTARNSPHIMQQGYDRDGNGQISQEEAGMFHYNTFGQNEGRVLPNAFSNGNNNTSFGASASLPGIIPNGFGGYTQGGNQTPIAQNGPVTAPQGQTAPQGVNPAFQAFYNSPDYQLAFNEGQQAIEGGAAARGGLLSGATAKAVTQYGQNMAQNQFGNYRNALNAISGTGQVASNNTAAAGQNYANQVGNNAMAVGQANANAAGQIYGGIGQAAGFGFGAIGQNRGWF